MAAVTESDPGPLASTAVSPSEPVATLHVDDQHRSSGGQSRAVAPGNAAAAYAGTAFRHSAASSSESQRNASALTVSPDGDV
jgi:hypothetical protein